MKDKTNDGTKAELTTWAQQVALTEETLRGEFNVRRKDIISNVGFVRYSPPTYTKAAPPPTHKEAHNFKESEDYLKELREKTKFYLEDMNTNNGEPFPNCCEPHKWLAAHPEFRIEHFSEAPAMAVQKILYTKQCIRDYYDIENWYEAITDYIQYSYEGFESMIDDTKPLFWVEYINEIIGFVESYDELDAEKKARLIEYLLTEIPKQAQPKHLQTKYLQPTKSPEIVYNIMLSMQKRWLELFPFDLEPYFTDLKNSFEGAQPMFSKVRKNLFTGVAQPTFHTPETLMELLKETTKELLSGIDIGRLIEDGIITNVQAHIIKIAAKKVRIGDAKDFSKSGDEVELLGFIERWLTRHETFFNSIKPHLTPQQAQQALPQPLQKTRAAYEFQAPVLACFCFISIWTE